MSFALPFDGFMKLLSISEGTTYDVGIGDITEVTLRADINGGFGSTTVVSFDYTFSGDDGDIFSSTIADSESPFAFSEDSSPFYVKPGNHQIVASALDEDSISIVTRTFSWKFIDSSD